MCASPDTCEETPKASQFIPGLHLAGLGVRGSSESSSKLCRGCFEIGRELIIEEMKLWKTSPGVTLQI